MIFFTWLGVAIVSLLLYLFFFFIIISISGGFDEENFIFATIIVGITISIILATFIVTPQVYGYQKITVSENTVEENI